MTKRALSLEEFNELSKELKLDILHRDGVHVGKRMIDQENVILFQLYAFYVEVRYKQYRKVVTQILTSRSSDILQPYLDQIHIPDLNKNRKGD
ncbi:MAG TPA: hypothetical protein VEZ55_03070 [Chitinophagaceae bacterium]|jgi:hypothetical protein|nr:hypothetical protein [Chitinophagaceae bacterium]